MILGFLLTNRYWNILEALPSRLLKCEITTCVSSLAYCSVVQDICIYYYFIRIYCARVVLFRLTTRTVPLFTIWSFGSSRRVLGLLANSLLCLVTTTQQRRGCHQYPPIRYHIVGINKSLKDQCFSRHFDLLFQVGDLANLRHHAAAVGTKRRHASLKGGRRVLPRSFRTCRPIRKWPRLDHDV
jgi:hypothetical protein